MITIYTDGSSKGNPGPGGWGAIIIYNDEISNSQFPISKIKEIGGREEKTTNNRMEITAAIMALENIYSLQQAQDEKIEIFSDSEYLIKGITLWIKNWQENNWRTKDRKDVLNKDLWEKLLELTIGKNIEWKKVAGHSGHELNERCDEIATSFADGKPVSLYEGSENSYQFHI